MMSISGTCKDFRIDHCKFKNADHMLAISGDGYGLIDHCCFDGGQSHGGNVQPVTSRDRLANYASRSAWAPPRRCTSRTTRSISPGRRQGRQEVGQQSLDRAQ